MLETPDSTITAVLGPTNTGKTHYAVERMLARGSGIIGLPLRLLAREIYDRIVGLRGPGAVSLITGEERIAPPNSRFHVCTVEAMPLNELVDFVAIDEVQLCADPDRGHVFTDRLLHARGRYETLFLGSDTIRPRIASLVPKAGFMGRERFSNLTWTGPRKLSRLKPRTAVVAFSTDQVYAIAELIRRQRGGAAVVMGALSPRTRNAQVALYQEGEVDYMVATDAIGMGLNMDVDHVAFAGTSKFDGWRHRRLEPNELAQIAGRAGRYTSDGTFGVTGDSGGLDPETIEAIESHRFKPLDRLMWRNTELAFHSVAALLASLEHMPEQPGLNRAREAEDQTALSTLAQDPWVRDVATTGDRVRLLWDVCQIPDYRKVSPGEHASLLAGIYRFLLGDGACIPSDWLAGQVRRLDRVDGDIDALSTRLAHIRTWTYAAHRRGWVEDPGHWQGETRAVEDRLSDALHERLTQRFVDRRTSVLMRRLKQKERLVADVNDKGEVTVEGHFLGRLDGFRFTVDETAGDEEVKTLRSASTSALEAEFQRRADKLYLSPDSEIDVTEQGGLMWGTDAVGRISAGDDPFTPKITVFVDDTAGTAVAEKVERRLRHWLARRIAALFEPLIAMRDDEAITGLARGVTFRLAESFGIISRREVADDVKAVGQEDRALLRKHGLRFGQHFIFMPALLKPAPTRMRLLLWSLREGHEDFATPPPPGHVTVPVNPELPKGYYEMAGYRALGERALRIDMLERLADLVRPMDGRGGFEATQDMLSITGLTLDQFADLMGGLGFTGERGERPRVARPKPAEAAEPTPEAGTVESGASEAAAAAPGTESGAPTEAATADDQSPAEGAAPPESRAADAQGDDARAKPITPDTTPDAEGATTVDAAVSEPPPGDPAAEVPAETPDEQTAGAAGPAPEADTAPAGDANAEPEIEVFYIFRQRPRSRQRHQGRGQGAAEDGAKAGGPRRNAGGKDNKGKAAAGKPPRGKGKGPKGRRDRPDQPPRKLSAGPPRDDRKIDPDSPFAVLQKLKNS